MLVYDQSDVAYPAVQRLLCKLYELCDILPVRFALSRSHPSQQQRQVRPRQRRSHRLHHHDHLQQQQQQLHHHDLVVLRQPHQLRSLVSDRDPSVLIAHQLTPLSESAEAGAAEAEEDDAPQQKRREKQDEIAAIDRRSLSPTTRAARQTSASVLLAVEPVAGRSPTKRAASSCYGAAAARNNNNNCNHNNNVDDGDDFDDAQIGNDARLQRRHEWYIRKCYVRELRIIKAAATARSPVSPIGTVMEEQPAARIDTPASFADEPVLSASGPGGGGGSTEERAPSRVRVHFFESGAVKCPSATGTNSAMDVSVDGAPPHGGQQPQQQQMLNGSNSYFRETQQQTQHVFTTSTPNGTNVQTVTYTARQSTDSGIDNPFRPEGELSMEADEIVKAIKEGRPFDSIDSGRVSRQENGVTSMTITTTMTKTSPTSNGNNNNSKSNNNNNNNNNTTSPTSPKNGSAKNGSATKSPSGKKDAKPGVVDVQRGIVVPPSEAQQAEQVVIKKKPKCKCCVIQ